MYGLSSIQLLPLLRLLERTKYPEDIVKVCSTTPLQIQIPNKHGSNLGPWGTLRRSKPSSSVNPSQYKKTTKKAPSRNTYLELFCDARRGT
ncbi:hypothetical protein NV381_31760 [Paenibacillus sp. N5-1-1-5]|uniref:Uncharacterized protein n=1 Tax=Paenibacillus radicis (ex Xue et al. 2023) TaxID=2972489 RepID=A0ABT1YRZ6_9BACL|nr:hypothetical protein [Paenibacillus radicis (ex Xue et al. 2023)]